MKTSPREDMRTTVKSNIFLSQRPGSQPLAKPPQTTSFKPLPPPAPQNHPTEHRSPLLKPSQTTSFKPLPPPPPHNHPTEHCVADLQSSINSTTYKPPEMHTFEFVGNSFTSGPSGEDPFLSQTEDTDPSLLKMKTIPPVFLLGDIPLKPPRPPSVDIEKFTKIGALPNKGYYAQKDKADIKNEYCLETVLESWPQQQEVKESSNTKEVTMDDKKSTKDQKKQLEEDKKLKKAKEKREKEARKKFKIKGEIQIIQKGMARLDYKGVKMDLPLKQGETIEIVRIVDNPEGFLLGRNTEGYYGYVKTGSIDVVTDPEVYDDVGTSVGVCGFTQPVTDGEEVYDDIESQGFPPPPTVLELTPKVLIDPKKKNKFEKEEKEFRKKFKFEGEVQVQDVVTIATTLATKKWGNKDLHLKPGEVIDVIVMPVDGRLIGRNSEGKFGYVALANVSQGKEEIYDDIGEECIYDND